MKRIFLILLLFISVTLSGQTDFKELFQSISKNDRFSNMMNLREYQGRFPSHAIPYFLYAEIQNEYMKETNPITLFYYVSMNYNEVKTYYGLTKYRLDEQQARRDREYFGDIKIITDKKNVSLPDILNEIDLRLASAENYYNNAKSVHDNYFKCINKYNESLFSYREILKYYPDYKDLYMLANDVIKKEVENIALNFDSSLVFFDSYRSSCSTLPHLLKVNNYQLNAINTYRLEGLIESDFSLPVVQLWDFKAWAENFLITLNTDIQKIRNEMLSTDNQLNNQIEKLKREEIYDDEFSIFCPEDKFLNLIGKYDYSSIVNELFNYKKLKISYLVKTRQKINNPVDSTKEYLLNRLVFFKDLAFQERNLNDEAGKLKKSVSIDKIGKYLDFFEKYYRGMDGLMRWCEIEKYDNEEVFKTNLKHLGKFIEQEKSRNCFNDSIVTYSDQKIAFGIQLPLHDSLLIDTILTTQFDTFKDKYHFVSGFEVDKKRVKNSFLAKVDQNGKVLWYVKPRFTVAETLTSSLPVFQQMLDDSTCVSLHRVKSSKGQTCFNENVLIKTNWNGEVIQTVTLNNTEYPRFFYVDEINEQILVVSKGQLSVNDPVSNDTMRISLFDFSGTQLWDKQYMLKGELIDVVFTNSNIFVACNYSRLTDMSNNALSVASDNLDINNTLALFINRDGTLKNICQYFLPVNFEVDVFKKISSNLINMVGEIQGKSTNDSEPFYLLIDSEGTPVFTSSSLLKFSKIELKY